MHALYRGNFVRLVSKSLLDKDIDARSIIGAISSAANNPIIMDDYDAGYHNCLGDLIRALEEYEKERKQAKGTN